MSNMPRKQRALIVQRLQANECTKSMLQRSSELSVTRISVRWMHFWLFIYSFVDWLDSRFCQTWKIGFVFVDEIWSWRRLLLCWTFNSSQLNSQNKNDKFLFLIDWLDFWEIFSFHSWNITLKIETKAIFFFSFSFSGCGMVVALHARFRREVLRILVNALGPSKRFLDHSKACPGASHVAHFQKRLGEKPSRIELDSHPRPLFVAATWSGD